MNTSFRDAVPALLVTTVDHTGSDLSSLDVRQMRSWQILVFAMRMCKIQPVGFPFKKSIQQQRLFVKYILARVIHVHNWYLQQDLKERKPGQY